MDLSRHSLEMVERDYKYGLISYEEMVQYIIQWNAGPHGTQAYWSDGAIRQFDPEAKNAKVWYGHFQEEFGVHFYA